MIFNTCLTQMLEEHGPGRKGMGTRLLMRRFDWPRVLSLTMGLSLGAGRNANGRLVLQATNYLRKASSRARSKDFIKPLKPPPSHPILPHGVSQTSFEPLAGPAKPCWSVGRRFSSSRLRDSFQRRQNSNDNTQERPDRAYHSPGLNWPRFALHGLATDTGTLGRY